jgi:uncharacterized membrane-anchored protein YhcB (DUF1043 family)
MLHLCCTQGTAVNPYIPAICTLIGVALGYICTFLNSLYTSHQRKKENQRLKAKEELENFYYPFRHLQQKSQMLYILFNNNKGKDFRTLLYLLQYGESNLSPNDKILLNKIIEVGKDWSKLILENLSYVTNQRIHNELSKLGVHLTVIELAQNGLLKSEVDRFKEYIFPIDLIPLINQEISQLESKFNND